MASEHQKQGKGTSWHPRHSGRKRLLFGLFGILLALDVVVLCAWFGLFNPAELNLLPLVSQVQAGWPAPVLDDQPLYVPPAAAGQTTQPNNPAPTGFQKQMGGFFTSTFTPAVQPSATAETISTSTPTTIPTAALTATKTPAPSPTATKMPTATKAPPATATATAVPLPDEAQVSGLYGVNQSLALSCESRSAVDWARFFGFKINEVEFQYALPRTDNPETGFVGNPNDAWGMIPPHSYGVNAGPVADLLHNYGVPARAYRGLGFDDIRREIAAGRPVIVWVVGAVWRGKSQEYTASDGQTTLVAPNEHTVMVAGYTSNSVLIQDGGSRYYVAVSRFRDSWRALGNMAIFEK
jgi:uncharacterized protein YvpB